MVIVEQDEEGPSVWSELRGGKGADEASAGTLW